jgi:hypothetical protein
MPAINHLSPREELELGVAISAELIDLIYDGKVHTSEIRSTLLEIVEAEGVGHTDEYFIEKVTAIYRNRFWPQDFSPANFF